MSRERIYEDIRELIAVLSTDPARARLEAEALAARGRDPEVAVGYVRSLAADLLSVRTLRQALADVEASVESVLARVMPTARLDLGDVVVERKGGAKRTEWDHDAVIRVLAEQFATDENGEFDRDLAQIYAAAVHDAFKVAQVSGYRTTTGLVARGIDPDGLCKREPGRRTVIVTPSAAREGGEAA